MIRTRRLAAGSISATKPVEQSIYTCPPGVRAIIRDIRIGNPHTSTASLIITVLLSGSGAPVRIWTGSVPAEAVSGTSCDVVLEAGDTLYLYSSLTLADYYLSGAELTLDGLPAP